MRRAIVPVASMLAIQVMISLSVLSLSVMMPAVASDLAMLRAGTATKVVIRP